MMDSEQLRQLLTQQESATLDFKQEFYHLDTGSGEARKREKHEMIKDILALTNGNPSGAGETAYLVVGAGDTIDADGNRALYSVNGRVRSREDILKIVNSSCAPPLDDLYCQFVAIDGKQLFVIIIPPSPHVHETTKQLDTPSRTFSEYTVLMRQGESVRIAAAADREAIRDLKRQRLHELSKAPPVLYGAALGGIVGGAVARGIANTPPEEQLPPNVTTVVMGIFAGGLGAMIGIAYKRGAEFWRQVRAMEHIPPRWRKPVFVGIMGGMIAGMHWITKFIPVKKQR